MPLPIGSVMPSIIKLDLAWLIILVDDLTIYPDLFVVLTLDMPPDVIEGRQRGRDTMCGRFASKLSAKFIRSSLRQRVLLTCRHLGTSRPARNALVVRRHPETGTRRLDALRWGLLPHFTKDLKAAPKPINARAETVASSGMFRSAFTTRRCIVPADHFYGWQTHPDGRKQPMAIARKDEAPLAFGGLWEGWGSPGG